jgi:2-oxoisovalerate dehydrogenase E2 component (dihydrolipoyl transacylase)
VHRAPTGKDDHPEYSSNLQSKSLKKSLDQTQAASLRNRLTAAARTLRFVEVETDKAVVEIPSPWSGTIAHLFGIKGDLVKVGAPLVEFSEGGAADTGTVVGEVQSSEPQRRELEPPAGARGLQVLPAVRALARKLDVDLNLVQGSGPSGMITRADVERAARSLAEAGPAEPLKGMRRAMAQR